MNENRHRMNCSRRHVTSLLAFLLPVILVDAASAGLVTLNTSDSVFVSLNTTANSLDQVGDFSSGAATGIIRERSNAAGNFQVRTRWFMEFDLSGLSGLNGTAIQDAKLNLPQIGKLNNFSSTNSNLQLHLPESSWDSTSGTAYPLYTLGDSDLLTVYNNHYSTFGSAPNSDYTTVEGTHELDVTSLVQDWVDGNKANNGVRLSFDLNDLTGLAFGAPTITVTTDDAAVVPEPGSLVMLGSVFAGFGVVRRRTRSTRPGLAAERPQP